MAELLDHDRDGRDARRGTNFRLGVATQVKRRGRVARPMFIS